MRNHFDIARGKGRAAVAGSIAAAILFFWSPKDAEALYLALDKEQYRVEVGGTALAILTCTGGCSYLYYPYPQLVISTGSTAIATVSPTVYYPTADPTILNLTLTGIAEGETTLTVQFFNGSTLVLQVYSRVTVTPACPAVTVLEGVSNRKAKLRVLYDFRDKVLSQTPEGREYTRLFYEHAGEVTWLLLRYPDLRAQARGVLEKILPAIRASVSGRGLDVPSSDLGEVEELVQALSARGSPELQQAIQRVWPELSGSLR